MLISKEDASRIAREDARNAYGDLSIYAVSTERKDNTWIVDYRLNDPLTLGGGPKYIISCETGEILSKRYEQ